MTGFDRGQSAAHGGIRDGAKAHLIPDIHGITSGRGTRVARRLPNMRLPRMRLRIRQLMLAVAIVAISLMIRKFIYRRPHYSEMVVYHSQQAAWHALLARQNRGSSVGHEYSSAYHAEMARRWR